ncbi:hypothetical protein CRG98_035891 [Punica granatum]|uniref:Uncharacterized protein n=1 Tax=Punica granatum TaxID=22663 RepID=A0A2I0II59_PUNGR|nr:hypothetical protein CRG98_035891 [Punica granatum]
MTSSSATTPSTTDVALSVETPFQKSFESKLDALYEVSYLSENDKISSTNLPPINLYTTFSKQPSFSPIRSIRHLIRQSPHRVKEYVQSTRFDQHPIQVSKAKQFMTLQIPQEFPRQWISQGYTHLHCGAIRLADRKGFTHCGTHDFVRYQISRVPARIGTIETTLDARTVFVTFFPKLGFGRLDRLSILVETLIIGDPSLQEQLHKINSVCESLPPFDPNQYGNRRQEGHPGSP